MLKYMKVFMLKGYKPDTFYKIVFLFLCSVLINVYTVTPDLRPVNDKVM